MNYNITDNTLLGGLSLAHFFFSDSISVGFSCFGLRRRSEEIRNQLQVLYTNDPESYRIDNEYSTEVIYGLLGKFGIQWMPTDIISVGTCVGQGMVLSHKKETQTMIKNWTDGENFADAKFEIVSQDITDDALPLEARAGVAVFPSKSLLISADVIANIGTQYYQYEVKNTFNGALGAEYYITPSLPIRLGVFTNFANTPVIDENKSGQEMHVDMYGGSMSLSWQTKNSSISLSGFYQTGAGKAQVADSTAVQDVSMYMYSVSLTGSAKY
jgi:long-chain fatty acid transport protein